MKIEIRRQVPIPEVRNGKKSRGQTKVYPWNELEIGDCFIVEGISSDRMASVMAARHRAHHQKYTRRVIDDKQWVWRIK